MFQFITASRKRFAYYSLFAFLLSFLFVGCRKQEVSLELNDQQVIEKFLKIPGNADPSLKLLINDLRKRDLTEHFITKLAKEQGYPLWEKAEVSLPGSSSNLLSANTSGNNSQATHFIIPVLKDSGTYVNATLISKLKDSTFSYKLFRKGDYKNYNLKDSSANTVNAKNIVSLFLYLERKIFDKRTFQITDKRLFKNDNIQKMFIQISSNKPKNPQNNPGGNSPYTAPCETLYEILTEYYTLPDGRVLVRESWTGRTMQVGDCGGGGGVGNGFVFLNVNQLYSNTNPFNNTGGSPGGGGGTGGGGSNDPGQCIICEGESGNGYTAIQIANSLAYNNLVSFLSLSAVQSSWLVTHPEYVITLHNFILNENYSSESIAATKSVLNLAISDILQGPYDDTYKGIVAANLPSSIVLKPDFNKIISLKLPNAVNYKKAQNGNIFNPQFLCDLIKNWIKKGYFIGSAFDSFSNESSPSISDSDPEATWWNDPTVYFSPQPKPTYANLYVNYPKNQYGDDMEAVDVFALVGGEPLSIYNSNPGANGNACALRVSRALLYSGITIPNIPNQTFKGADNKYYFLSAARLYNFMNQTFGTTGPNVITLNQSQGGPDGVNFNSFLDGNNGIYIMKPVSRDINTGFGASGHATLYSGGGCMGNHCYFDALGGVQVIRLWKFN